MLGVVKSSSLWDFQSPLCQMDCHQGRWEALVVGISVSVINVRMPHI